MDCASGFANTQKNQSLRDIQRQLSRRIQITEKTALKIRFDVVNFSTKFTNCVTAAASVSARRNSASAADFTERSLTIFELRRALAVFL